MYDQHDMIPYWYLLNILAIYTQFAIIIVKIQKERWKGFYNFCNVDNVEYICMMQQKGNFSAFVSSVTRSEHNIDYDSTRDIRKSKLA